MNRYLFSILFFCVFVGRMFGQVSEKDVLRAIKANQTDILIDFLEDGGDINKQYDNGKYTLLNYAIKQNNPEAVKILLENGADPDLPSKDKTPLINAAIKNQTTNLYALIDFGADLETKVKKGNTALIYASKSGRLESVKMLVENGADVEYKNNSGLMALDYANMANYIEVAEYLVKIIEMRNYYTELSSYTDGPHMEWYNDSILHVFYMIYDTIKRFPVKKEKFFTIKSDTTEIEGFAYDNKTYTITRDLQTEKAEFSNVKKILSIGDIHGHYNALVNYLKVNEVIDEDLQWIWGDGHIVFLGDVFDRGNEVTESLWFIYQLDLKAREHGGRVHMLLGNHEVMVMLNDTRYLNRKYEVFSNYFMRDYADFFNMDAILGQWLRTRNSIIRINDCIFSHAGISPTVYNRRISLDRMNSLIRDFLAVNSDTPVLDAELTSLVLNSEGPLWYRGYILDGIGGTKSITEKQVNSILKYYKASKIIIAHTEVKRMISLFEGKVIAIDVPIRTDEIVPEALFIEDGNFYRLTGSGEKISCIFEVEKSEVKDQLR